MILKVIFANSVDPDQTDLVHTICLYAKNRFEKFASIFSRRHKQTTFSDAGFLGVLRVNRQKKNLSNQQSKEATVTDDIMAYRLQHFIILLKDCLAPKVRRVIWKSVSSSLNRFRFFHSLLKTHIFCVVIIKG